MDLNPGAFPLGTPHLLRAGTTIMMPSPEQIRLSALKHNPGMKSFLVTQDTQEDKADSPASRSTDQSQWVRFP